MTGTKVIVITGASSGFGNLAARALARAGHIVYAGMRATADRNAGAVAELAGLSAAEGIDALGIEMDVQDQASVPAPAAVIRRSSPRTSRPRPAWTPWPKATPSASPNCCLTRPPCNTTPVNRR